MSEKVVVLNSGGFDSIVLLHYVYCNLEYDKEVVSLHFNYGEANKEEQNRVVKKVCEKLGIKSVNISIPKLMWTQNKFYDVKENEPTTKYLEYRNLIFLSYAVSLAESIGAKKIYLATLKSHYYKDTSISFLNGLNEAIKESGIEIVAPFCEKEKIDLIGYVVDYDIQYNDFFTCDTPVNGIPCGKCNDCLAVKEIMEIAKIDHYHKAFVKSGYDYSDPLFRKLLVETPVEKMKVYLNNTLLLKERILNCILKANKVGIKEFCFLVKNTEVKNLNWFIYRMKVNNLKATVEVILNGSEIDEDVLQLCGEKNIPVSIVVDVSSLNLATVEDMVESLLLKYSFIKSFYFRFLGVSSKRLTTKQLEEVFFRVKNCAEKYTDKFFQYDISIQYENEVNESSILSEEIYQNDWYFNSLILDNFSFSAPNYCKRYAEKVVLTPEGYLLGCESELTCEEYSKISVGNCLNQPLKELIEKGKEIAKTCNDCYLKCGNERKICSFLY